MTKKRFKVLVELYELLLTLRKDDRSGRVVSAGPVNIHDLIQIAKERRSDISPEVMLAAYQLLRGVALEEVLGGKHVDFGLVYNRLSVEGVFIGDHASWDSTKNSLVLSSSAAADVREAIKDIEVEVLGMAQSGLFVNTLVDVTTGDENKSITPGGGVNLTGVKIKIAGEKEGVGLYLDEVNTGEEITVPMTSILINEPSKITFIVPADLPAGDYRLKITTQYAAGTTLLNEPRTYVFDYVLACNVEAINN